MPSDSLIREHHLTFGEEPQTQTLRHHLKCPTTHTPAIRSRSLSRFRGERTTPVARNLCIFEDVYFQGRRNRQRTKTHIIVAFTCASKLADKNLDPNPGNHKVAHERGQTKSQPPPAPPTEICIRPVCNTKRVSTSTGHHDGGTVPLTNAGANAPMAAVLNHPSTRTTPTNIISHFSRQRQRGSLVFTNTIAARAVETPTQSA